jgi:hypothetical protein
MFIDCWDEFSDDLSYRLRDFDKAYQQDYLSNKQQIN